MIQEEIVAAITEFGRRGSEIPNLKAAVLFGSGATGTLSKKSDIDILLVFDTEGNPETGPEAAAAHSLGGEIATRMGLAYAFSFVMYGRNDTVEPALLREVLRDGIVLFAKTRAVLGTRKEVLDPYLLVAYSLKGMRPKEKMALQRGLFGYTAVRNLGGKRYRNSRPGLVGEHGRRIGPTVFILRFEKAEAMRAIFRANRCKYTETPVWFDRAEG
jgi:Polymerase beta, Nucleotidyltransferase